MAGSTRERILDAAESRFAEKGFAATSLGEIADEVGIRTPSLYKHFDGKQALYEAVLERLLRPFVDTLSALIARPLTPEQSERNLMTVASLYCRKPHLSRLVQHAALGGTGELELLMERWFAPLFNRAAELTTEAPYFAGRSPRDALRVVVAFHSLMSGYVTLAPLHARLLGEDPMGEEALREHEAFLRLIARSLWSQAPSEC